jgi:cyclophilin family peptidyl-prolyl cis-trans isomerase
VLGVKTLVYKFPMREFKIGASRRHALCSALLASLQVMRTPPAISTTTDGPQITSRVSLGFAIGDSTPEFLTIGLFGQAAPASVELFERLCTGSVSDAPGLTYAGSAVHRIEPGRLIAAGRLAAGDRRAIENSIDETGRVRSSYTDRAARFVNADTNTLSHDRAGLVSMRKGGGAFEFILTTAADQSLDAEHIVIGEVISGESTLDRMNALPIRPETSKVSQASGTASLLGLRAGVAVGLGSAIGLRLGAPELGAGAAVLTAAGMSFVGSDPKKQQPDLSYRPLVRVRVIRPAVLPPPVPVV